MNKFVGSWVLLSSLFLVGCQSLTPKATVDTSSIEQMQAILEQAAKQPEVAAGSDEPPANIADALVPPLSLEAGTEAEERFDIAVEDLPASEFFMGLVKDTDFNMVVHPGVTGNVSLQLKNVSVGQVMQLMRDVYSYDFVKSGNLYRVMPGGMSTRIFKIDYLNLRRMGQSETRVSSGRTNNGSSGSSDSDSSDSEEGSDSEGGSSSTAGTIIETRSEADFWSGLTATVSSIIGSGDGRRVVVSPQTGMVVVHASAKELIAVEDYLDKAELALKRQVIIEAKILEVELSDGYEAGIRWAGVFEPGDGKTVVLDQSSRLLDASINIDRIEGVFGATFNLNDFTGVIELLGTQGTVQVLSSPRISTVNNQKAVIKVGQDEYFVTDVSSETTVTGGGASVPTVDLELTPFFSGIALDVTPQIGDNDEIILHIHPSVSEVEDQSKTVRVLDNTFSLPLALSTIRESDTIVKAQSGQVVVIGGLMQNAAKDQDAKTPGLSRIPLLGHAFRQKEQSARKSELVILLKPVVTNNDVWRDEVKQRQESIADLKKLLDKKNH